MYPDEFSSEYFDLLELPDSTSDITFREPRHRRVIGPRQFDFLVDCLNSAWNRLPVDGLYRVAFETIICELGRELEQESNLVKHGGIDKLDLITSLQAYQEGEAKVNRRADRKLKRSIRLLDRTLRGAK